MDNQELRADEALTEDQDMDGEGDYNDEEYDEDEDGLFDDEDEDAEAVAKRLGEALWADISKAYAQQASEPPQAPGAQAPSPSPSEETDDEQTLTNAIQTVLSLASNNTALNDALSETTVPGTNNKSLLHILTGTAETKEVSSDLADTLSNLLQSVADGFAST